MIRSTAILLSALAISFSAGCSKDEAKQEAPAPNAAAQAAQPGTPAANAAGQAAPGNPAAQPNGAKVVVGQQQAGGQIQVQGAGNVPAVNLPNNGGKPTVMQNGTNKLTVDETGKVEGKTGDGRSATVKGDTTVLQAGDKTVQIKGGKVIVPGVGEVPVQQ